MDYTLYYLGFEKNKIDVTHKVPLNYKNLTLVFYDYINFLAHQISNNTKIDKHLIANCLFLNSKRTLEIGRLLYYIECENDKPSVIKFNLIDNYSLQYLNDNYPSISFEVIKIQNNYSYLDYNKKRIIGKYLTNKLFQIKNFFSKDTVESEIGVRSWVEITFRQFKLDKQKTTIYLHPFSLNLKRQLNYVAKLKQEGYSFKFLGIPFSLSKLINCIFNMNDKNIMNFYIDAYKKFRKELTKTKFLYTSDDFDPFSFILYPLYKVKVINVAHV